MSWGDCDIGPSHARSAAARAAIVVDADVMSWSGVG